VQMQQAQDAAVQQQVDSVRDALLNGLDHYPAPKGMETNFYDFRTEVQKVLRQYQPKPGESADEALAALRSQYEDRVATAARAESIPTVADDLSKADDAGNAPITVVDGPTKITYGPAYRDHATNPPQPPSHTDNGDGTSTVSFIDEHGRQVTIVSSEMPDVALGKYKAQMPPLPAEPQLSPEAIARMEDHRQQPTWPDHRFDPTQFGYQGPGGYLDAAHQHLGFPPMTPLLTAQANGTDAVDAGATGTSDGPPADGDADTTAAAAAQVVADDDVVGDTDDATSGAMAGAADADGDDGPDDDATTAAGADPATDHQAGDDLDEFSSGSSPSSDDDDDVVGDTHDTPASPAASRDSHHDDDDDHDASAQQQHADEPDPFATQDHDDDPFATPAHHEDDDDAFAMPKQDSSDEFDSGGDDSHGGDSDSHDDSHEPDDHDFD
ncbi:MAG TPA: hypothetical protein VMZ66_00540, partial [Aeromicrobium sp.]|nr:hypothetical protein [Aeromicrobium sp.]